MAVGGKRRALVLDDDVDYCNLLTILFDSALDVECLGMQRLADLAARAEEVLACELAILDVNLGPNQPSGLDALEWLRAHDFAGEIVFVTGHAGSHPLLHPTAEDEGIRVLEKPVPVGVLLSLIHGPPSAPSTTTEHAR